MSFLPSVRKWGVCLLVAVVAAPVFAQFFPQGTEYPVIGALPGDQVHPHVSINSGGGFIVWDDNNSDGNGQGVSATRLDANFTGSAARFRVNQNAVGNQENAQVALLNTGGAAFVWQGGKQGFQHIYARFRSSTNTWLTGDLLVSTATNRYQSAPCAVTLGNGNVLVVWASFNQAAAGSLQDIYGQLFTPAGQKIGGEFLINQFTPGNQRAPAAAALSDGKFAVAWISEQQRWSDASNGVPSVDVYGRIFDGSGVSTSGEFLINTGTSLTAYPGLAASSDGGFLAVWMEKDHEVRANSWDLFARKFSGAGTGGTVARVNVQLYGDQYLPKAAAVGTNFLAVWTSLGQDGSREGVYGRYLNGDGSVSGTEFRVNASVLGAQMHQSVAADPSGRFLVAWTTFAGGGRGFDLRAQRYGGPGQPLFAPAPPGVTVVSSNTLFVSWPALGGVTVDNYEIFADGNTTTAAYTGTDTSWTMTGLANNSTHSFQLAYVVGGETSPLSLPASATTYDTTVGTITNVLEHIDDTNDTRMKLTFPGPNAPTSATPLAFSALKGAYNGLFCDTNDVASESAGFITITTTAKGGFSAKLSSGGVTYSFSGSFNASGQSSGAVSRTGKSTLTVTLQLDLFGGDQIAGSITDGNWTATLLAFRAGVGTLRPAAGKYTFVIPGHPNSTGSPAGNGAGSLALDAKGNISLTGTLADGTAVSGKTALSRNNAWPFYSSLYGGGGAILGWMKFDNLIGTDFYGAVIWSRHSGTMTPYYTAGFTNATGIWGSFYTTPSPSGPFGNGSLTFKGGNASAEFSKDVRWDGKKVTSQSGNVSVTLTTTTGTFKGSVTEPDTGRTYPFQGALFEKSGVGLGYFLGADQSGDVSYGQNQ